jgi:hypothetical protein
MSKLRRPNAADKQSIYKTQVGLNNNVLDDQEYNDAMEVYSEFPYLGTVPALTLRPGGKEPRFMGRARRRADSIRHRARPALYPTDRTYVTLVLWHKYDC